MEKRRGDHKDRRGKDVLAKGRKRKKYQAPEIVKHEPLTAVTGQGDTTTITYYV